MPFLRDLKRRKELDKVVQVMEELEIKADGDLNYVLYKFARRNLDVRYNTLKNYLGELNEAACQIRNDILVPYEAWLKQRYGDVIDEDEQET